VLDTDITTLDLSSVLLTSLLEYWALSKYPLVSWKPLAGISTFPTCFQVFGDPTHWSGQLVGLLRYSEILDVGESHRIHYHSASSPHSALYVIVPKIKLSSFIFLSVLYVTHLDMDADYYTCTLVLFEFVRAVSKTVFNVVFKFLWTNFFSMKRAATGLSNCDLTAILVSRKI
jgi:hypothetical protein